MTKYEYILTGLYTLKLRPALKAEYVHALFVIRCSGIEHLLDCEVTEGSDYKSTLMHSFNWEATLHGFDFWDNLYEHFKKI